MSISVPVRAKESAALSKDFLVQMYRELLRPRLIEERMLLLLRQGKVSKWFSGIGQEAIAVGATLALRPDEYILPLHRNLGVFTARRVPLERLVAQWQGGRDGFTKGRDRSFHFGTKAHHIVGMISHLGPQLCVADGLALAAKLRGEGKVALVFSGEGGTSEGDFHEALNVAAVWDLPVLFLIENNGYALSTPAAEQFRCETLADRARGYGMEGISIDGNSVREVYQTISRLAAERRRTPRPALIECRTFRMRGHEEASGVKYVPSALLAHWAQRDPIERFERELLEEGILGASELQRIRAELKAELGDTIEQALGSESPAAETSVELEDVYAPSFAQSVRSAAQKSTRLRFIDAVSAGLREGMERNPDLVLMGQDIGAYGGVFKVTEGFLERFGSERVRNTPLCESAILGAALGLAIEGIPSVVEMQFADFVSCGFNQIVNNLAKVHYRWGQPANVVVRLPTGAGTAAGPFHSQSNEAWFFHVPGLKIVYPAFPADAKGLLLSALEDPNPVLYFEHKLLYRSVNGDVPDGYAPVPIGKAQVVREGGGVSVIAYGAAVHWAVEYANANPGDSLYILDLRSLCPLDFAAIRSAVQATGRVVIVHEDTLTGGIGAEIAAWIGEHCFTDLDAPVFRCGSLDTPVPFAPVLEANFLAKARLGETIKQCLRY